MDTIKNAFSWLADKLYRDRSNAWKAAVSTAVIVFATAMLGATLNLWEAIQNWINGSDPEIWDDLAVWGQAAFSAMTAFFVGLVNYIFRWAQAKFPGVPGEGPSYSVPSE